MPDGHARLGACPPRLDTPLALPGASRRNCVAKRVLPANMTGSVFRPRRMPVPCLLALALLLACAAPAWAQGQARPNIVVVMTDDQTLESVRVMNNLRLGLMAEGTTFEQTVTGFPLCCPSRATYLTGQYAQNHGVKHNVPPFGGYQALDGENTLPVWLRNAGYRTIHLGRYRTATAPRTSTSPRSRRGGPTGTRWSTLPRST